MFIKVLKTIKASKNESGTQTFEYLQGETYDIYQDLAEVFVKEGWGEKVVFENQSEENQSEENQSEENQSEENQSEENQPEENQPEEKSLDDLENKAIDNLENKDIKPKKGNRNAK